jgi:hypothetical protein
LRSATVAIFYGNIIEGNMAAPYFHPTFYFGNWAGNGAFACQSLSFLLKERITAKRIHLDN